jgi:hypothetical protein
MRSGSCSVFNHQVKHCQAPAGVRVIASRQQFTRSRLNQPRVRCTVARVLSIVLKSTGFAR